LDAAGGYLRFSRSVPLRFAKETGGFDGGLSAGAGEDERGTATLLAALLRVNCRRPVPRIAREKRLQRFLSNHSLDRVAHRRTGRSFLVPWSGTSGRFSLTSKAGLIQALFAGVPFQGRDFAAAVTFSNIRGRKDRAQPESAGGRFSGLRDRLANSCAAGCSWGSGYAREARVDPGSGSSNRTRGRLVHHRDARAPRVESRDGAFV